MIKNCFFLATCLMIALNLSGCIPASDMLKTDYKIPDKTTDGLMAFSAVCRGQHFNKMNKALLFTSQDYLSAHLKIIVADKKKLFYWSNGGKDVSFLCNGNVHHFLVSIPGGKYYRFILDFNKYNITYFPESKFLIQPEKANYIGRINIDARQAATIFKEEPDAWNKYTYPLDEDLPYFKKTYKNIPASYYTQSYEQQYKP